jgi:hypothetical protein
MQRREVDCPGAAWWTPVAGCITSQSIPRHGRGWARFTRVDEVSTGGLPTRRMWTLAAADAIEHRCEAGRGGVEEGLKLCYI